MRTAFVTGGTGFLGLNLIEQLSAQGDWKIYALYRPTSNTQFLRAFDVELVEGSINDYNSLMRGMPQNVDAVFHLAANVSLWKRGNQQQYEDNVVGTKNMLSAALLNNTKRFVHTSSVSAFGIHHFKINEQTPSNAMTLKNMPNYHITKYQAELEVLQAVERGLDAVILNPCHIVGKFDQNNWSQLIKGVYQNNLPGIPSGSGAFCYAQNVAKALISAVEKGKAGERFLLGGIEATFLTFINEIQKIVGKPISKKATPNIVLNLAVFLGGLQETFNPKKEPQLTPEKYLMLIEKVSCNFQKAQDVLGYEAAPLPDMINACVDWLYQENLLDK